MAKKIDKEKCDGCGACIGVCPLMAIHIGRDGKAEIDHACIGCGECSGICWPNAIVEE